MTAVSATPTSKLRVRVRRWAAALLAATFAAASSAETIAQRAARIQKTAIVVDPREDVPEQPKKRWADIGGRDGTPQVDIPRLREGGVTAASRRTFPPGSQPRERRRRRWS